MHLDNLSELTQNIQDILKLENITYMLSELYNNLQWKMDGQEEDEPLMYIVEDSSRGLWRVFCFDLKLFYILVQKYILTYSHTHI